MIEVVNLHKGHCDDFGKYPYDIYVGWSQFYHGKRLPTSVYRNPHSWKKYGKAESVELFKKHTLPALDLNPLRKVLERYGHLRLGCWDVPDPCHATVIKAVLEEVRA